MRRSIHPPLRVTRTFPAFLVALAFLPSVGTGQSPGETEVPEPLRKLQRLEGEWIAERVEFLDEDGDVRRVSRAEARNRTYLGGLAFHHRGRLLDPEISAHAWYYYDPESRKLRMASVNSLGHHDEFVGGWEGERLVMVSKPRAHYGDRVFRMIHMDFGADSYLERLEVSEDGGASWRPIVRQRFRRPEPAP